MSENLMDYKKRTCIICGCHTSQTINIYERRSGPNIVQLIQARFKFQPLNDDKYLCYSCNNWLINWHSLQAVNSNNPDNSSSNLRSSNLNNTKPEMTSTLDVQQKIVQFSKPIALIRPQIREQSNQLPKKEDKKHKRRIYSKQGCLSLQRKRIKQRKSHSSRRVLRKSLAVSLNSNEITFNCKNCCKFVDRPDMYLETLCKAEPQQLKPKSLSQNNLSILVNRISNRKVVERSPTVTLPYLPRQNQKVLIDGKIVSMLRRLGTTLSRDVQCGSDTYKPPIMSPTKKNQNWRRDIADDEILVNFNTAISEVLSYNEKKLSYHLTNATSAAIVVDDSDEKLDISKNDINSYENNMNSTINLQQVYSLVPNGLTVSLISDAEISC